MRHKSANWAQVFILGLCCLLLSLRVSADQPIPPLQHRVTDLTGTLSPAQQQELEGVLKALEERKGSQFAVLIVPTTEPEVIEQYGIRVADAWKLGREKADDGVIFLIAKNDRKLRFEVSHGLEGAIPDAIAKRVIAEVVVPHFKSGDFYGGIKAGVDRVARIIDGEPLPPPEARDHRWEGGLELYWFMFMLALVSGTFLRALFGRLPGSAMAGGLVGFVTLLLAGILTTAVVLGIVAFVLNLFFDTPIRQPYGGQWRQGHRRGGYYGGWGGGTWTGGGGSWGGDSGSGGSDSFSGGGGSFGGGGASGEW
jgi:uncharacterized protein